ncbi:ABC transporter permease [Ruminococcus gauvreauii]|uniref:ABC transporter permease n=1 Tax=Ruminococcus gauvreauii TaxID=438033 RepID=UPI00398454C8
MKRKVSSGFKQYMIFLIFIALIIIFSIISPAFFAVGNAMNIIRQISMMGIVTVGFTFVLIGGGLDLSVGSQIAIMNIIICYLIINMGVNPILALIIGIAFTTLIGTFNGFVISRTGIPPLIATLAMQTALRGAAFVISNGYPMYGIPDYLKTIGQGNLFGFFPIPGLIMIAVIVFGIVLLNKTYIGRHFYALGSNEEALRLTGVNTHFTRVLTYALLGFLTGIAGIVMLCRTGSGQPNIANSFEMDVLTAAVLGGVSVNGGKGSIAGAIIGAAIIGVLNNGMSIMGANDYWQQIIKGIVLLAVVVFDSFGRSGKKAPKAA